ncbi:MAG: hypothetical protein VX123_05840 [Pseudomonadota bacterium]|nr:hypothetical protein [Pseudomonadota bacterium]
MEWLRFGKPSLVGLVTGTIVVVAWSLVVSLVILLVVRAMVGLRVDQEDEIEGLDVTAHGERSYML